MDKKPKVVVNITKKSSTTIDKNGQVISEKDMTDKGDIADARAKKLGFKK